MSLIHEIDYGTPRSISATQVTLTIDGRSVCVPEGTSIMRAAMEMGTQIPKLCATGRCGRCTPCRIGSTRGVETLDKVAAGVDREKNLALVADLCNTMKFGSLCALGGFTPYPVMSAINHFPEDFAQRAKLEAAE